MNIAIIGWGSLIWSTRTLRIRTRWKLDGPTLPVEFARISTNGRLTLVLNPGSGLQRTYWAISEMENLEDARKNLRFRERCKIQSIHHFSREECDFVGEVHPEIRERIKIWMAKKIGLEAVVWTGLESNWNEKRHREFSPHDAVGYVKEFREIARAFDLTREYIRNAPPQIQTTVREFLKNELMWIDSPLAGTIFEPEVAPDKIKRSES